MLGDTQKLSGHILVGNWLLMALFERRFGSDDLQRSLSALITLRFSDFLKAQAVSSDNRKTGVGAAFSDSR